MCVDSKYCKGAAQPPTNNHEPPPGVKSTRPTSETSLTAGKNHRTERTLPTTFTAQPSSAAKPTPCPLFKMYYSDSILLGLETQERAAPRGTASKAASYLQGSRRELSTGLKVSPTTRLYVCAALLRLLVLLKRSGGFYCSPYS